MSEVLRGANVSAQWYEDNFPGSTFPRVDKFLLHSTETESWPGYKGGASAPNATYNPRARAIRQHFSNNRSSRALRDPSGTAVRENRDNVFQLEIIAYSDARLAATVDGLWIGDLTDSHFTDLANIAIQLHQDWGLPLTSTVGWNEGGKTPARGVRLSGPGYDAYRGILAHMHVSGNEHWDVGGFRWSRMKAKIAQLVTSPPPPQEDDVTPAEALAAARTAAFQMADEANNRSTPTGRQYGDDLHAIIKKAVADALAEKFPPAPPA